MNHRQWFPKTFALILMLAFANGLRAQSPVTISVDAKNPGAEISPDFSGLSFEVSQLLPDENGNYYFNPQNRPLIHLFRTLGIKNLRIGGNTSDRDARKLPGEKDLDSFFAFAKAADVKVIYCLRLHNGDVAADVQMAKYIMARYADEMDCFSIGQEPSAYPVEKRDARPRTERMGAGNEKYQYAQYRVAWKKFADTLIAAVPGIKFCGPGVHNNGAWAVKFIRDFGRSNHVALITEHLYPGGSGNKVPTPEIGRARMLADDSEMTNGFAKVYQKLYDSFVPVCVANGLPYRLEEVNNYFNGGAADVSDTFASALWGLDFMYWWAAHGAAGLNFHTGDKVAAGYSLRPSKYTAFFTGTNGFNVRPLGYGIKLFALSGHGRFLPATISNPNHLNLSVYAVQNDDKKIYLTLINKEHGGTAKNAEVILKPASDGAQSISLTAPGGNIAAVSGEMLGGAEIKNDGSWNGRWTNLTTDSAGLIMIKIPAASATVVRWTPK